MNTCDTMQHIIEKLATKHSLDLTVESAHLRLEMPGYDRLVIEKIGPAEVSVAHYFEQNGDLMRDPEITFAVINGHWVPTSITQDPMGVYRECVTYDPAGDRPGVIIGFYPRAMREVADFARLWARNIREQRWLAYGEKR